jgi:hypothetical protein
MMVYYFLIVVWVLDPNLRETMTLAEIEAISADKILNSLEEFDPAEWGLPAFRSV